MFSSARFPVSRVSRLIPSYSRYNSTCLLSHTPSLASEHKPEEAVDRRARAEAVRSVFVSQSHCVYTNLALEQWLFRYHQSVSSVEHTNDNSAKRGNFQLLLWRNGPCVVVGRHQNPWQEASGDVVSGAVPVARRYSGGGCVYHDMGNLNLTFIGERRFYDRAANLQMLADTINSKWPRAKVTVNERHDLLAAGNHKVSGSAAKLTRTAAYHHCTLLIDGDLTALRSSLPPEPADIESKATASVRSPVTNLTRVDPAITVDQVMSAVTQQFLQPSNSQHSSRASGCNGGIHMVNPSDDWFPGLSEIKQELSSNEWVFGKTPAFSHTFPLPDRQQEHSVDRLQLLLDQPYSSDIAERTQRILLAQSSDAKNNSSDERLLAV